MACTHFLLRRVRRIAAAGLLFTTMVACPVRAADPAPYDLPGPGLRVSVTRHGVTLPIAQVPDLATGDRLVIHADLPEDQRTRFLLVSAFLGGATNPPPKDWIASAETWKRKEKDRSLALTVPAGARQLVLFLVPETGSAESAIADAVRAKPGEFVRAVRTINQASLDRSRLNAFVAAIRAQENSDPEHLKRVAPALARSLAIKLNAECLDKVVEFQAACLLENRDTLVLADMHSKSVAETLAGAPTDLALQLSYTREAGLGYYSQYIAVVRDIARLFGAFSNPQFRYLPTLALHDGERVALLLNSAPSFAKPKSVLVAAMPAIGAATPPRLRNASKTALCGADPALVLPVEGGPLVYSTGYARDMTLRLNGIDMPVTASPTRGGYVLRSPLDPSRLEGSIDGQLRGYWGFDSFAGPSFRLQFPTGRAWTAPAGTNLVVGRENRLRLVGAAPACVAEVTMRTANGNPQPVPFVVDGEDGLVLTLPMADAPPGDVSLEIRQKGVAGAGTLSLRAYREASRVDALVLHAGDRHGQLLGQRLDQVERIELGGKGFVPDVLERDGGLDRLRVTGLDAVAVAGPATARITLTGDRVVRLPVIVRAPRPRVELLGRTIAAAAPAARYPIRLPEGLLADTGRLTFSIRGVNGALASTDGVEIADTSGRTLRLAAGPDLQRQDSAVLIATLEPKALGPGASGPLRFRLVRQTEASDWQPLATLVRLPAIESIDCAQRDRCALTGRSLFLIEAIAATPMFESPVAVPEGFTASTLQVPAPVAGKLYLRLRDAPAEPLVLDADAGAGPTG